ncbi:MAG TPA: terminase small subunit [Burkholderiales bacterium]|nr:terminase small subunit [Burkholderiales bacterium]
MDTTLTDRQQRFVFEYLKDQNASAAAERAGYSARSRASQAGELMGMPAVRECIRIEMTSLLAELRLSALDLMKERMRAAFFRAGKLFDASGRLLGFEEMEAEVRDSLIIGGKWRKGEPEVSFRMPNREPALRALERVHERLEKLNEAHYAALEKERWREAPLPAAPGAVPPVMWAPLKLEQAAPAQAEEGGGQAVAPVTGTAQAAPLPDSAKNSQVFSGSANTSVVQTPVQTGEPAGRQGGTPGVELAPATPAPESAEISQGFSGSPEKPARPSVFAKALSALLPEKKEAPIKRRDPNLLWGGTPKSVVVEPSPALAEHLARIRHEELNAEVKREMALRGGKIKPGTLRPPGADPGYNPPWLRDNRPRYAIGAGEFYFSGEEPEA